MTAPHEQDPTGSEHEDDTTPVDVDHPARDALEQAGTHPLGAAAGALGGAMAGAVAGIAAGPVGSLAGAIGGAIAGGVLGSGATAGAPVGGPLVDEHEAPPAHRTDEAGPATPDGDDEAVRRRDAGLTADTAAGRARREN